MTNEKSAQMDRSAIDDIMNDIKDVITDKKQAANTDVFELTEVVREVAKEATAEAAIILDKEVAEEKQVANDIDILDKIDSTTPQVKLQQEELLSEKVANDTKKSLEQFVKMTSKSNIDSLKMRSGGTVEDIIVELLKPQLSDWLNKNLSSIVTQVVEREVKKLIPKE
ncbi:MAG: DUF2497 domain-containing protein [Rickettsiales bacterium]